MNEKFEIWNKSPYDGKRQLIGTYKFRKRAEKEIELLHKAGFLGGWIQKRKII